MALYPDTTSFYSAKIVAGPLIEKNRVSAPFTDGQVATDGAGKEGKGVSCRI